MNVCSLELAKELYKLSGWEDTEKSYNIENDVEDTSMAILMHPEHTPAYDLGYLLRKLPPQIRLPYKNGRLRNRPNFLSLRPKRHYGSGHVYKPGWEAIYLKYRTNDYIIAVADTPEDAAAKLAIELFKPGILKNEA